MREEKGRGETQGKETVESWLAKEREGKKKKQHRWIFAAPLPNSYLTHSHKKSV